MKRPAHTDSLVDPLSTAVAMPPSGAMSAAAAEPFRAHAAAAGFAARVVAWQREHGRHGLPWQRTQDAYRIWLSEIMLQQTQVSTVIPYYGRFLARFPDVRALAAAPVDDVMALWGGLGYYSRARNLHRCAQQVVERYAGVFPTDAATLAGLPGIGRSTAAAIAAFSSGAREAILDGNVKRVLARIFGVDGFPGDKRVETAMWTLAVALLPPPGDASVAAYTQGLMDLGATLCVRGTPLCTRCPFASICVACLTGRQAELPVRRPKKAVPTRSTMMLVLRAGNAVLLYRRPPSGIWGGLWSLPEAADEAGLAACASAFGASASVAGTAAAEAMSALAPLTHVFTHFRLDIAPRLMDCAPAAARQSTLPQAAGGVAEVPPYAWVSLDELDAYGLPAPVRRLLDGLRGSLI